MKKILSLVVVAIVLATAGCSYDKKAPLLPEVKNDSTHITIGTEETYQGGGYTIKIPKNSFRFEKDYDDGAYEEKWEYIKKKDTEIKVTTYKNSDGVSARKRFLRENDDYIFEDLTGVSICGKEFDGDTLWFNLYENNGTVYIVSWEYPKNTNEEVQKELASIAATFKLS